MLRILLSSSVRARFAWCALVLFPCASSCKKPDAEPPANAAANAAATSGSSTASAGPAAADASTTTAEALHDGGVVDAPAWPTGASPELKLTWAVYPPVGEGERSTRNVELVARIGDVARRVALGKAAGALLPQNESVCGDKQIAYEKTGREVAKVTFYVGGASTFAVERASPGLLAIERISASDGYCPNDDCDTRTPVAKIAIPEDARIVEAISDIRAPGREAPFDCGAGGGSAQPTCAAPEVQAFDVDSGKALCGKPCKSGAGNCAAGQICQMALKSNEATMGMAAARANEIFVCRPPRPASSGSPRGTK